MNRAFRCTGAVTAVIIILWSVALGESTLSWRVFKKEENTWIYYPKGLMLFSTLSRTVKPFTIDPVRATDTLTDCIEYDGYLWVSSNAGVYQIDMATQSVERIALPDDATTIGKLALDFDYLWLATDNALLRFDRLGREWMTFDLPEPGSIVGLWANGDEVFWQGKAMLFRFTTATEKWNRYPVEKPFSAKAVFYPGISTYKVIDGSRVSLYQPDAFSWRNTILAVAPEDIFDEDSVIYYFDGRGAQRVTCASGMTRVLNIPNPGDISALAASNDSLIFTNNQRIGKFSLSKEAVDFVEYDPEVELEEIKKIIPLSSFLLLVTDDYVSCYEKETRAWQHVPRKGLSPKVKIFSWNEEECAIRYAPGYQSTMSGSIKASMSFEFLGYDYDTTYNYRSRLDTLENDSVQRTPITDTVLKQGDALVGFNDPEVLSDFNFHTSDKNDRIADVFFNNTSRSSPPSKGLFYRGNRDDYLNALRIGTTSSDQIESPLLPEVSMEGGSIVLESRSRLKTRDRKIVRATGGSGYVTTRTISKVVQYRADGTYKLKTTDAGDSTDESGSTESTAQKDTVIFVKGSCKVTVDGELLDTSFFNFFAPIGLLQFNSLAPIDPTSSIVVEYQVQTVPKDRISDVEFIPSYDFGKLHYGQVTVSPTEWVSAQVGYEGIDRDFLNSIVNVALPLEFRNNTNKMMLKFRPEFLYNIDNKARAGNGQLQSRIGEKTGIVANGMFADSNFISTDTLSRGYGTQRGEYDVSLSRDIIQELPLNYYQHQRFGADGSENRYAFKAGARFNNFPFLELSTSRTVYEKDEKYTDTDMYIDSLFHRKDKVQLRLYETSSTFLEKITRFYKISYDLTHSEYRTEAQGEGSEWVNGRLSTMNFSLAPVQRIMLSGELFYRGKMHIEGLPSSDIRQSLNLQVIDAPPGIDISAINNVKFARFASENVSTDSLQRSLGVIVKPGKWISALGWFSPRGKITQNARCRFSSIEVPFWHILSGLHDRESATLSREVGVNIYPIDGFLYTNTNEWSKSDGSNSFKTLNTIIYTIDARNTIQARWDYTEQPNASTHEGSLSYGRLWFPWLRTIPAMKANINDDDKGNRISWGPRLTINLNVLDFGIIRALANIHEVEVKWNRRNGVPVPRPDVNYLVGFRVKVAPNIEAEITNTMIKFVEGKFNDFTNMIILSVYF